MTMTMTEATATEAQARTMLFLIFCDLSGWVESVNSSIVPSPARGAHLVNVGCTCDCERCSGTCNILDVTGLAAPWRVGYIKPGDPVVLIERGIIRCVSKEVRIGWISISDERAITKGGRIR